ncbi:mitochondrial carrier [Sistotremastrum niveocremeum HHB9708]|uniref:Mitochondrial carrier n=1 Tax=Sistotremastrum niveocremeum HHB9708 TaxID=1314777 RepID=A0A164XNC4_9AGAM|nr:mitochondrial carrier [Sistotremastrum niveocremeum HHB9708]
MDPLVAKMIAGATGSSLTALSMTPFDVIKTRLQTQPPAPLASSISNNVCCQPSAVSCVRNMSSSARLLSPNVVCLWENGMMRAERVNGFWDAAAKVWRTEGLRGLWKGVGTSLLMAVPASTTYMITYDHLLREVIPSISPSESITPLISGSLARTIVATIISPLELLRTNLQSTPPSPTQPHTLRSVFADILQLSRRDGVFSLWRGLGPTLWRDVPFSGIYWANYESWKAFYHRQGYQGAIVAFVSGATSGTTAALITSPFDVLKTRRQALLMSAASSTKNTATFPVLKEILQTEGISALYAGISPRIAKIAPACGIMIACFEVSWDQLLE